MRTTGKKEIESVLRLDGPTRFAHFVKRVVDDQRAWGLWKDGWALMEEERGKVFPLWPAREDAEALRFGEWSDYEPSEITLDDLLCDLIPKLEKRGVYPGVFPTPSGKGVVVTCTELSGALLEEMKRYQ